MSNEQLTPNMRRICVQGEALTDFPTDQEGGYVKLLFESAADQDKPRMRSYTVRHFDVERCRLALDFVDHGDNGPASAWANGSKVGDRISLRGPGAKKLANPDADWFLIAGDMSALPAISVNLEQLPGNARGHAVVEVLAESDRQTLKHPEGMTLTWLINPNAGKGNPILAEHLCSLEWLSGTPYVWFAGEFESMRSVRRHFCDKMGIDKRQMYISCYWKCGETDEGMKRAKRLDPDA